MDTENRLTAVSGEGVGGWVKNDEGIKENKNSLINTDNSMGIARG